MHEILTEIDVSPDFLKDDAIKKYANNTQFKKLLSIIFDPRIEWDLPSGMPPHKRDETIPPDYSYTTLGQELRTMYVFFKPSPLLNNLRRESRYIQLLESLHYTEADLLTAIKDGKFSNHYPTITMELVYRNFPDVFNMDGIFARNEYVFLIGEISSNGGHYEKILSKEELELKSHHYFITFKWLKNILTGEYLVEPKPEKIPNDKPVEPIAKKVVAKTEKVAPKEKSPGRPRKKT